MATISFANLECMIPKSMKIFEITGIEVTAIAIAITILSAKSLFAGPRNCLKSIK